jgi:hypothetical protein
LGETHGRGLSDPATLKGIAVKLRRILTKNILPIGIRVNYNPLISEQLSKKLTSFFEDEKIDKLARETGFIQRERAVSGSTFAQTLVFSKFDNSNLSLEELAETFTRISKKQITKQAIDLKFTSETVAFFKKLIEITLHDICLTDCCYKFLLHFREVRIKDSTCFQLPKNMSKKYPGSGGGSSKACIRIQFEYDLKTGRIIDLSLHPFTKVDLTDAIESINDLEPGCLIIRDLGYTCIEVIRGIKKQKSSFISRLINGANVYQLINNGFELINFKEIYQYLLKHQISSIEKDVYVTDKKEPVRMIIEIMPEELIKQRLVKAEVEAKKKGRKLSEEYKAKSHLNIFITNVSKEILNTEQIHKVYTLRWQVELIFKIWKSVGEIHKIKKMKIERFESFLYAKLLWIIINWMIVWKINQLIHTSTDKLLSYYKTYKSLKERKTELCIAIQAGIESIQEFIDDQISISTKHHLLEKKKNQNTMHELIQIM